MSKFINDELETSFKEPDESEKSDEDASDERVEYEKTFMGNFTILVNPKHKIQEGSGWTFELKPGLLLTQKSVTNQIWRDIPFRKILG